MGNYISNLHLPNGDVIADNQSGCVPETIITMSDAKVFVIPNDRDYQRVLADPLTFHAHYMMVAPPTGLNLLDTMYQAYPTLYASGAGFAKRVHQFTGGATCPSFRLYRVTKHPSQVGAQPNTSGFGNR